MGTVIGWLIFPGFRAWIKSGIEGDDDRLQGQEIRDLLSLFVTAVMAGLLVFIVFSIFIYGTVYPLEIVIAICTVIIQGGKDGFIQLLQKLKKPNAGTSTDTKNN